MVHIYFSKYQTNQNYFCDCFYINHFYEAICGNSPFEKTSHFREQRRAYFDESKKFERG